MSQSSGTVNWLYGVSFTDANIGMVVGDWGTILRTTNGGATWTSQPNPMSGVGNVLTSVSFTDANMGTAVGSGGSILRTTDGGASWTSQSSGTTEWLQGVSFTDANTGTAVGSRGIILRTTDGGINWTSQANPYQYRVLSTLYGVFFTDFNKGITVGDRTPILRTTDGGATWTSQFCGTTNSLYGVCFTNANTGTVVGSFGTILRTTTGGVTWLERDKTPFLPQYLTLTQNYPNPFNPSTTIRFEIPGRSYVALKIYDLLGREVATLVNETLDAGWYTTIWNANRVASGIYVYRLQAGEYQEGKKLVLLR